MKDKKTIIVHDTFLYKGGWERLIMMMWKALGSDIASWFFDKNSFDLRANWFKGKMIEISSSVFKKWFRHIKLKMAFMFKTGFLKDYDYAIFSWDCASAVKSCKKDAKKIMYCHTPPRYLYDQHERYASRFNPLTKPIFKAACVVFRYLYEKDLKKFDKILTNSKNTQKRLKDYIWVDSDILYPPVDMSEFKPKESKDYYLSYARLSEIKRVDKIVEAFRWMSDKNLIVIYWKNDPQREDVFALWEWCKNIKFITLEDNSKLKDYIGNAIATLYIPVDEDFGMSPVESMACGKPVVWVNEWGLKETVIDWETWVLIAPEAKVEDIKKAVKYLSKDRCKEMEEACVCRAKDFSIEIFKEELTKKVYES